MPATKRKHKPKAPQAVREHWRQLKGVRDGLATDVEAADFLHIARSSLWNLMNRGDLAFVRIPGTRSRRIPWAAIFDLAARNLVGGPQGVAEHSQSVALIE